MLHNEVVELLRRLDDLYRAFGSRELREVESAIVAIRVQADEVRRELLGSPKAALMSRRVVNRIRVSEQMQENRRPLQLAPGVLVDWQMAEVYGPSGTVRPTPTEWLILTSLAASPGNVLSDSVLVPHVWGEKRITSHILRVNIARLREKLMLAGCPQSVIERRIGVGYRLVTVQQARAESAA
jgi:DNA-binding response OmpR family regulator